MRLQLFAPLILSALAAAVSGPAKAEGTVFRATGCGDRIFVVSTSGFSILTAIGADGVADEDALVGKVDAIGHTELYDKTRGFNFSAIVDDRQLDRSAVMPRIAVSCRAPFRDALATGTVLRSDGCGNRIIVSAEQGFAVFERLAGGIVGRDDTVTGDFNRPGRATVKDNQTGSILTVFVEDYELSRAAIDRKMTTLCSAGH
jgi:hypothetical protein